ncbi:MAG: RNA polymerase sigma factor [Zavarzinella sp.]
MMTGKVLSTLIERHAAALVLYARQFTPHADDVVQEAFIELAAARKELEDPLPWLFRVVRNKAVSCARSDGRRQRRHLQVAQTRPEWFVTSAEHDEELQQVQVALQRLPQELREVVVAHLWGGLSFDRIAPLIGISAPTCWRRYQEAIQLIREQLGEPCKTQND